MTLCQCFLNSWNFCSSGWITNLTLLIAFWVALLACWSFLKVTSSNTIVWSSGILSPCCRSPLLGFPCISCYGHLLGSSSQHACWYAVIGKAIDCLEIQSGIAVERIDTFKCSLVPNFSVNLGPIWPLLFGNKSLSDVCGGRSIKLLTGGPVAFLKLGAECVVVMLKIINIFLNKLKWQLNTVY